MSFDDYVGLPFAERGRGRDGLDCWGLLHLVYQERFGIVLPRFDEAYATTEDSAHIAALMDDNRPVNWIEVPSGEERTGDGVLMSLRGYPRHVGIVTEPGRVLHIERATGSIIEAYGSPRLRSRLIGFYRYSVRSGERGASHKGIICQAGPTALSVNWEEPRTVTALTGGDEARGE